MQRRAKASRLRVVFLFLGLGLIMIFGRLPSALGATANLQYGNGPIMHESNTYAIYWLPSGYHYEGYLGLGFLGNDSNYESLIDRFLSDLGGSSYYNIVTQYHDRPNGSALDVSNFRGYYVDSTPYPLVNGYLNQSALQDEIVKDMKTEGWVGGLNNIFLMFTGLNVDYTQELLESDICAYHSYFTSNSQTILWANMPDFHGLLNLQQSCSIEAPSYPWQSTPNNDDWADNEISVLSHELFESVTDPLPNSAWNDSTGGGEIGDKCNMFPGPMNSIGADLYLNGHPYIVQEEWSNFSQGCVLSYGPSTTFSLTFNPAEDAQIGKFNISYVSEGVNSWTTAVGSLPVGSVYADANSQITLSAISSPGALEKSCFIATCQPVSLPLTCGANCVVTYAPFYYYDLIAQTASVNLEGGGTPTIPMTYASAPLTISTTDSLNTYNLELTPSPQTIWVLRGTSMSAPSSVIGAGAERWATVSAVTWTVTSSLTLAITYFHQYQIPFSFALLGPGVIIATPPLVSYTQFGEPLSTQASESVWADAGTTYSYPITLSGSSSLVRLAAAPATASGLVSSSSPVSIAYYYQFAEIFSYSTTGGGTASPPQVSTTQYGVTQNYVLSGSPLSLWVDSGSGWTATNPLSSSTSVERWQSQSASGLISDSSSVALSYVHQYLLTMSFTSVGRAPPSPPVLDYTDLATPVRSILINGPVPFWADSGSQWSVVLPQGAQGERWITNSTVSGSANSPITDAITYLHQYYVEIDVTPSSAGTTSITSGWFDEGAELQLSASPATGYSFTSWTPSVPSLSLTNPNLESSTFTAEGTGTIVARFALNTQQPSTNSLSSSTSTSGSAAQSSTSNASSNALSSSETRSSNQLISGIDNTTLGVAIVAVAGIAIAVLVLIRRGVIG